QGYPETLPFLEEINRYGPKDNRCQGLIGPGKVAPNYIEIDGCQHKTDNKERNSNNQPVLDWFLIEFQQIANRKPGAPESGIARSDRRSNNTQYGQYCPHSSQQGVGDLIDHPGGIAFLRNHNLSQFLYATEETHADCGPDQCYNTLDNHCTIEYLSPLTLIFHTACH